MYKLWGQFHYRHTGAVGRKRLSGHVQPKQSASRSNPRLGRRLDAEVAALKEQALPTDGPQLRKRSEVPC